jgi:hypothetical protein
VGWRRAAGYANADARFLPARSRRVRSEKELIARKFKETRAQLEDDTDKEIEELKARYEAKLQQERDATLRLQGLRGALSAQVLTRASPAENGIMKKKFSSLKKDIEDQRVICMAPARLRRSR